MVRLPRAATTVLCESRKPMPVAESRNAAATTPTIAYGLRLRRGAAGCGTATSGTTFGAYAVRRESRTSASGAVTTLSSMPPSMSLASRSVASSSGSAIASVAWVRPNSTSTHARRSQKRRGSCRTTADSGAPWRAQSGRPLEREVADAGVEREEDDLRLGEVDAQHAGDLEAGHPGHRVVEHDQVGVELEGFLGGFVAVRGLADDLEVGIGVDKRAEPLAHGEVGVGEQNPLCHEG